jgi:hypothetical protein
MSEVSLTCGRNGVEITADQGIGKTRQSFFLPFWLRDSVSLFCTV